MGIQITKTPVRRGTGSGNRSFWPSFRNSELVPVTFLGPGHLAQAWLGLLPAAVAVQRNWDYGAAYPRCRRWVAGVVAAVWPVSLGGGRNWELPGNSCHLPDRLYGLEGHTEGWALAHERRNWDSWRQRLEASGLLQGWGSAGLVEAVRVSGKLLDLGFFSWAKHTQEKGQA